jgi:hypothetical protein
MASRTVVAIRFLAGLRTMYWATRARYSGATSRYTARLEFSEEISDCVEVHYLYGTNQYHGGRPDR